MPLLLGGLLLRFGCNEDDDDDGVEPFGDRDRPNFFEEALPLFSLAFVDDEDDDDGRFFDRGLTKRRVEDGVDGPFLLPVLARAVLPPRLLLLRVLGPFFPFFFPPFFFLGLRFIRRLLPKR